MNILAVAANRQCVAMSKQKKRKQEQRVMPLEETKIQKNQYEEKTEQKIDARKTLQNINNLSVRTNK